MLVSRVRAAYHQEWLMTNGLGGYAMGPGNLLNQRKYHGLLVASQKGGGRLHVLAGIEEQANWQGQSVFLDANHYPDCVYPQGYEQIAANWLRPHLSVLYSSYPARESHLLLKEVMLAPGAEAVLISYRNLGSVPLSLILRPKFSLRNHHLPNPPGTWDALPWSGEVDDRRFALSRPGLSGRASGWLEQGDVLESPLIYRNVYYPFEAARGFEALEDLLAPVELRCDLAPGQGNRLLVAWGELADPWHTAAAAQEHYYRQPLPADHPQRRERRPGWLGGINGDQAVYSDREYIEVLRRAAADFLVSDDIMAGYPWYGPRTRDTLLCLGGLPLLTGGCRLGVRILKRYGRLLSGGLLPDEPFSKQPVYRAVDTPLWFVLRCWQYAPQDRELLRRAKQVVLAYLASDKLPFFLDPDGLIALPPGPRPLTWMDAEVHGRPVTARWGKPVDVNALWYNALRALADMARRQGMQPKDLLRGRGAALSLGQLRALSGRVKKALASFYDGDYLRDRLLDEGVDDRLRPNAVIALSLPFAWLDAAALRRVLATAGERLLTSRGLRTLNPRHAGFKRKYLGNESQRALALHQGSVWPWLLAPFLRLAVKALGGSRVTAQKRQQLAEYIFAFRDRLQKNQIATLPELYDGLDPQFPKGCPAKAASVFALLEAEGLLRGLRKGS